jgi:hypothetical protein
MKCLVEGCEGSASRSAVADLNGEFDSYSLGYFRTIVDISPRVIPVCDDHFDLSEAGISEFVVTSDEWNDDMTIRVIRDLRLFAVKLDGYREPQGSPK